MNAPTCPSCGGAPASTRLTPEGATWGTCGRCGLNFPMTAPSGFGAPGGFGPPASFGVPPSAPFHAQPIAPPRAARPARFLPFLLAPVLTCLPMIFIFSPRACSSMDDSHAMALDTLRSCPRAQQLLGDDIDASWVGLHTGESSSGGGYGQSSWSFDVEGSRARGSYSFHATMEGGRWRLASGTLSVNGQTVQLPGGCSAAPPSPTEAPAASGGACDRLQACCDAAPSEQLLEGICRSAGVVRSAPNAETTCQTLFDSAGRLLGATGRPIPPACQ